MFELLTAEFLFDPHGQGELFTKDDDHMAQIIELLGDFSLDIKMGGKYSRELFDHTGASLPGVFSPPILIITLRCSSLHSHFEAMAYETGHDGEVSLCRGRRCKPLRFPPPNVGNRYEEAQTCSRHVKPPVVDTLTRGRGGR